MNPRIAHLSSWFFHPSFLPTMMAALLLNVFPLATGLDRPMGQILVLLPVLLFTCVLPGLTAITLNKMGVIDSLEMQTSMERRIPFLLVVVYYVMGYYTFKRMHVSPVLTLVMLGTCLSVILALIINYFWKISIHMLGIGAFCGILAGLSARFAVDLFIPTVGSVLVAGILGTARLSLGAHNPAQVYMGFFAGFTCEFALFALV